jgi:hypothetical protein
MKTRDQDRVDQPDASPRVVARRDFVGTSVGAAAVGAAVIAGADKAVAQDAEPGKFSTPDWRTLKPGAHDSDLYQEETGFPEDTNLTWWPGRNVSGVTIGLVQMRANLPMLPGNMGNATTFNFPMMYREMNANNVMEVMSDPPSKNFEEGVVEAAKWLELQGVRAIMGNCGFFGNYQKVVQARIDTPFYSSSLMQLPMIVRSMPRKMKVAVITANGPVLSKVHAIENCGLSTEDKANRIVIEGCETGKEFTAAMSCNGKYHAGRFEAEVIEAVDRVFANHKDIGSILLECTELSPHAHAVQKKFHMPVWDYTTLTNWIYAGCVRRLFTGHM